MTSAVHEDWKNRMAEETRLLREKNEKRALAGAKAIGFLGAHLEDNTFDAPTLERVRKILNEWENP